MNPNPSHIPPATLDHAAKRRKAPLRERSPVLAHLRSVFFAGLLTAIPLFITVYIIGFFYAFLTKYTQLPAVWIVELFFPASDSLAYAKSAVAATFAVLMSLLLVYVMGLLGTFLICRQILAYFEHFIENLPLIKGIYGTTKQVMAVFRKDGGGAGFQRVVLVQFPREGTWTVAFVTNTVQDPTAPPPGRLICCFIPMTPNPTSGFFQMFPENQVRDTDWSVDMGIKIVLSGGLLAPEVLHTTTPAAEALSSATGSNKPKTIA